MTARPLRLAVIACVAVVSMGATGADAQPRVRLSQREVTGGTTTARGGTTLAQTPGATRSTNPAPPQPVPITPTPSSTDATGSGATTTLPALTAPSLNFDPYTCPPVDVCPPECPPAVQPVYPSAGAPFGSQTYSPTNSYRFRVFGDYVFLQPSGAAVTNFALPVNGAIVPLPDTAVPLGPVAATDPDYTSGFRAGVGWQMTPVGEWAAMFTFLQAEATQAVSVAPAGTPVLRSLVFHPGTSAADAAFLDATATSTVDIMLGDVEYRGIVPNYSGPYQTLRFVLGGRYAKLDQDFSARFTNAVTVENVANNIEFQGAGLRVGLDGERRSQRCGFLVYGRGSASFITGEFESTYTQQDNFAGTVATTSWKDDRIVPILDLEVGLGWKSPRERFLLSAGYLVSAWYNVVSHEEFIGAVRATDYTGIKDTLVFDGPVARAEFRF